MTFTDLSPAASRMADLIGAVPDDLLTAPTPCAGYTVADLLDHIDRFTLAFTAAAAKAASGLTGGPVGDGARLGPDWRARIRDRLSALPPAWQDPAARSGMTRAGGIDMPAEVAHVVALEELTIHGWDLARASGQPFAPGDGELEVVRGFIAQFAGPDQEELRGDAYRSPVPVAGTAPLLDRVVALSGRDPSWSPS
ncbi:MAG TPA: TIGR03086 family metal-binding protein [Streptosporangiaceae bacterium]|jgi:uncharacterized protein (TIGR03086 family)